MSDDDGYDDDDDDDDVHRGTRDNDAANDDEAWDDDDDGVDENRAKRKDVDEVFHARARGVSNDDDGR